MNVRSTAFDAGLACAVLAAGLAEVFASVPSAHVTGPAWALATTYGVASLLLVVRRIWPLACLLVICGVLGLYCVLAGSPEGWGFLMPPLVAGYTVANLEARPQALAGLAALIGLWVVWAILDPLNEGLSEILGSAFWLSPWVIAWLVGSLVRSRRLYAAEQRLEREHRASRAVAEERNRIARELHDVIGHSVSVMTVQASAVRRRLTPDQEVERQALETVEAVGREALTEMRRMVGVLRGPDQTVDLAPQPGLAELDRLVESFRASGLPLSLHVTGTVRPLAPGLDLTAYRLIQEALTNALRHAVAPTQVQVRVVFGPDSLELTVLDDGHEVAADATAGSGLLGMRERVEVYGGVLTARPRNGGGGFELVATVPLEAP